VLQYAHEHGCPWNELACSCAARHGHLEVLQYAHEHGYWLPVGPVHVLVRCSRRASRGAAVRARARLPRIAPGNGGSGGSDCTNDCTRPGDLFAEHGADGHDCRLPA
jgi:hypothetical protein